jgi:hypothetical protein
VRSLSLCDSGSSPTPACPQRLHPAGLSPDWADKLHGQAFVSLEAASTHEHYLQVVLTTIEPKDRAKSSQIDAYEYTVHSHSYVTENTPNVQFRYVSSPIQVWHYNMSA